MNHRLPANIRELLEHPRCRPEDLGRPLPDSGHATSVCLPTWQDVVDYEEQNSRVMDRLAAGYPRFFFHPRVRSLAELHRQQFASNHEHCHVYASPTAASRAVDYLHRHGCPAGRTVSGAAHGVGVVCFPIEAENLARRYWRHSGEGISSRRAEDILTGRPVPRPGPAKARIRKRIADLLDVPADHVFLYANGMQAIYSVYRSLGSLVPGHRSVQFGFPYTDTLKIQEVMRDTGVHFLPRGDAADLDRLEAILQRETVAGIFCEFPSNPLLSSPDLTALHHHAARFDVPLVMDDTLGTYVNVDILPHCEILTTSLTKYFTGAGDVMAGAAIINPNSPKAKDLFRAVQEDWEDQLYEADAVLVDRYAEDFIPRVCQINSNAATLTEFLIRHPLVAQLNYPQFRNREEYDACRRPGGGYGGLFSFLLKDPERRSAAFYNALELCKGPNLGTSFSLCCPYTMLAHYEELSLVEQYGVSRWLIRCSVGLEPADLLIDRFQMALATAARLR